MAVLFAGATASAARVIFYQAENGNPDLEARLNLACRFYGIDLDKTPAAENGSGFAEEPVAVVIEASCLDLVLPSAIPATARGLLIAGVNQETSDEALKNWTGDAVQAGLASIAAMSNSFVQVSSARADLVHELAGQKLPVDVASGTHLEGTFDSAIISYPDGKPLFVQSSRGSCPVYLLADLTVVHPPDADIWFYDYGFFGEIAPYMIFLKQTFGSYAWHADGDYANLTIDDPWLRDAYGRLRFADLLREMDLADFHATIAFIPWNYDRKRSPDVVRLFRERPDRFSLCIHGNNHDHREFYRYEDRPDSHWPARPFVEHEADIRQGLARMEALRQSGGLSYDPVMVFPHDIAPEPTLELLRKYNFLATANIGKVPLDSAPPRDPLFWLRRTSDEFGGGLAAIDRTEAHRRTSADMAVDLFLDNPVLFVEHLLFFANDTAAFNRTARQVNEVCPDVQWASLGTISRHLYLLRDETDGSCTVRAFSPELILRNTGSESRLYRIIKRDSGTIPLREVRADGLPAYFTRMNGSLQIELNVPAGSSRHVQIVYQNDFDPAREDLSKKDRRINTLRRLSDVRDIYLTGGPVGIFIDRFYYGTGLYRLGLKGLAALIALVAMPVVFILIIVIREGKRRRGL
jgi:hypothetical protein